MTNALWSGKMMSLQARKRKSTVDRALKRASGWWKEADVLPEYALELRPEEE